MNINFMNIKNLIVGLVFAGMGLWCISLDFVDNIKLLFSQSVIESSVSNIEDHFDPGVVYRLEGKFDFSSYYILKNIRDSQGGYSEEVKAFLYRLRDADSHRDLLIKADSAPDSMERLYSAKRTFLVTIKEFSSGESFSLIAAGSRGKKGAVDPADFTRGLSMGDHVITSFYGEMHSDMENAKSMAAGELAWKLLLGAFMMFIGLLVIFDLFRVSA